MSLNTQLRLFLLIIFTLVFTGNFLISVNESKDFLQSESYSRAHDTSTSLALSLSPLMKDVTDPKIHSLINIVSNRGFFKEIRLDTIAVNYEAQEIFDAADEQKFSQGQWQLQRVSIDQQHGELTTNLDQNSLRSQLAALEQNQQTKQLNSPIQWVRFLPNDDFIDGAIIQVNFEAVADNNANQSPIKGTASIVVNRLLVNSIREDKLEQTPQWFVNLFPIIIDVVKVELSDGWKKIATLSISSNPANAYHRLYQHVYQAFWSSLIALIITMLILSLFLHKILRPLLNIQHTVEKIGKGVFEQITDIPSTVEFKNVALAINDMSGKLNRYIDTLNNEVIRMNEDINIDSLTQLALKPCFEIDFAHSLTQSQDGYVFVIKINNLSDIAKTHESHQVDDIIKNFAQVLTQCSEQDNNKYEITPYRFFGGEFSLLVTNASHKEAVVITKTLTNKFNQLTEKFNLADLAYVGVGAFEGSSDLATVLHAANEALESAKQIGPNEAVIKQHSAQALDLKQWHNLAEQCVHSGNFIIDYVKPSKRLKTEFNQQIVMVEAFTRVEDSQGNNVAMATFISMIEKFKLNVAFDQQVITKIITDIKAQQFKHQVLVNLSVDSISNADFIQWLTHKLVNEKNIAPQLVFSIGAYAVAKHQHVFKQFTDTIHKSGSSVIIKRYDPTLLPLKVLQGTKVDAVRLTKEQTIDIALDSPKQKLVKTIQELTELLDIKLYAEDVLAEADMQTLKELGIYAASDNK